MPTSDDLGPLNHQMLALVLDSKMDKLSGLGGWASTGMRLHSSVCVSTNPEASEHASCETAAPYPQQQ